MKEKAVDLVNKSVDFLCEHPLMLVFILGFILGEVL